MRNFAKRTVSACLAILLVFGLSSGAFAAWEEFSDVSGHWAEETLRKAHSDGLIAGFEDKTLRPDTPITTAQMITILYRVLGADYPTEDYAAIGLTGEEWYAEAAAAALRLGLISSAEKLDEPMTRAAALTMMARAFQLVKAEPDFSVLAPFSDGETLSGETRLAMASLVEDGYIIGAGDTLNAAGNISRAEFFTLLYRIASSYQSAASGTAAEGGAVLRKAGGISGGKGNAWAACDASENFTLQNLQSSLVVLRQKSLQSLAFLGTNRIDRLVIAAVGATGNLGVAPYMGSVNTLVIGDTTRTVSISGSVDRIEITGSNVTVSISGARQELVISGSGNTVTLAAGSTVGDIRFTDTANRNTLTIGGTVSSLTDLGKGNSLLGSGTVQKATVNSGKCQALSVSVGELTDLRDLGIEGVTAELTAPETLPAGTELTASAVFTAPERALGKTAKAIWSIDGVAVSEEALTLEAETTTEFSYTMKYSRTLPESCILKCELAYTTEQDEAQAVAAEKTVALENYDSAYYDKYEKDAVLSTVTTGYKGNWTLAWAQSHDYDETTKTIWVNAKGYSSTTKYLIWVSIAYQRVNIFEGSKGNWTLIHEYLCGSGAPGNDTPVGTFTVFGKQVGWFEKEYTCRPIVNFKAGSGYAFHSRLYNPGWSETFSDARIGFPISHGCLRMYSEDVQWMYDNIPIGTTVVVY